MLIKYEDIVTRPKEVIYEIIDNFDLEFEEQQLKFYELIHHNLAGNRMRMATHGSIFLDEEYKKTLSLIEWWIATSLSYRGLQLFKYPLRRIK